MRLVRQSAIDRDFAQGLFRRQQHLAGALDALAHYEGVRRFAKALLERFGKVGGTESDKSTEVVDDDGPVEVIADELDNFSELPVQQLLVWRGRALVSISGCAFQQAIGS